MNTVERLAEAFEALGQVLREFGEWITMTAAQVAEIFDALPSDNPQRVFSSKPFVPQVHPMGFRLRPLRDQRPMILAMHRGRGPRG